MVEQWTENPCVAGSIPALTTSPAFANCRLASSETPNRNAFVFPGVASRRSVPSPARATFRRPTAAPNAARLSLRFRPFPSPLANYEPFWGSPTVADKPTRCAGRGRGQTLDASEDRQQAPASIVAGECVQLDDHAAEHVLEELVLVELRRHEDRFERFRGRQQAVARFGQDASPVPLRRVSLPAGGSLSDQRISTSAVAAPVCSVAPGSDFRKQIRQALPAHEGMLFPVIAS